MNTLEPFLIVALLWFPGDVNPIIAHSCDTGTDFVGV